MPWGAEERAGGRLVHRQPGYRAQAVVSRQSSVKASEEARLLAPDVGRLILGLDPLALRPHLSVGLP